MDPMTRRSVLQLVAERTRRGRSSSYRTITRELDLSEEAACDCLKRLWRERLIEAETERPSRFRFRLEPRESLRGLRFSLAERGRDRLRWWIEKEKEEDSPW